MTKKMCEQRHQCHRLLLLNSPTLNTDFLNQLSEDKLNELTLQLQEKKSLGSLLSMDRSELLQLIGSDISLYFYHDTLNSSQLIMENHSPLSKKDKLGQGKFADVFLFESETKKKAVKYGRAKQTHFAHEHKMTHQAGINSLYFFHPEKERLVLPFIEGKELIYFLKKNQLTISQWLLISIDIAEELMAKHNAGVIHNDITPFNIKLDHSLKVHLIDFGESTPEMSLKPVDVYSFCNMLLIKFIRLQKNLNNTCLDNVIQQFDQALNSPQLTCLSDLIVTLRAALVQSSIRLPPLKLPSIS